MGREREKRWWLIVAVMLAAMLTLAWKLYDLTITKGDFYRNAADTKRVKEVAITAPRGNIYDRNGVLLAGTRSSFAVQGFKDDLMRLPAAKRNDVLLSLIRYIECDGAAYLTTFPITLQAFTYATEEDYFTHAETATDYVERMLREHQLVGAWLSKVYTTDPPSGYSVSIAMRALNALSLKGAAAPIQADPANHYALSYETGSTYDTWVQEGRITDGMEPLQLLASLVQENENLLSKVLNHPAARQAAYELLVENGLQGEVVLTPYLYTYPQQALENKASLHRHYPQITAQSSARSDFVQIVRTSALEAFLTRVEVNESNEFIVPAKAVLEALEKEGVESNLTYNIEKDAQAVTIQFKTQEQTLEKPMERLQRLALESPALDGIITDDRYKGLAEQAVFSKGIYPRISIASWVYGYEIDQSDFIKRYDLGKLDAQAAFYRLREAYELEKAPTDLEALGVMTIVSRLQQQGNLAYVPVILCYEVSQETVAKIEETIPTSTGIIISPEPIRYYPFGETACHILGYIGKIATEEEIDRYVTNGNYRPDELIGKTGVEESFEDTLHGVSGKQTVQIDAFGNRTATVRSVEPKAGNNLYLSIDVQLQIASEKSLEKSLKALQTGGTFASDWGNLSMRYSPNADSGATISTDPNTGELLAMASYPAYDPNLFVTGISESDWTALMPEDDKNINTPRPLLNIVTQTAVQPGSTFKPLEGVTAMENGLNPYATITCSGYMDIGDRRFECLVWTESRATHGPLTLPQAIGQSCNYYFYTLALGSDPRGGPDPTAKVTVEDIQAMAHRFGLDERSGLEINIPQEAVGKVPSTAAKLELTKAMLRNFLEADLAKYKKADVFKNEEDIAADIRSILDWIDQSDSMTRTRVIESLDEMGYEPETPLADSYTGLADKIKYDYLSQAYWSSADALNMMIGQGQNAYTPAEINRYCAALANGGKKMTLTLIKEIRSHDDKSIIFQQEPKGEDLGLRSESLEVVREGMRLSAQDYYASSVFGNLPLEFGSKTGTAERGGVNPATGGSYEDYSWFMAFAPFDDPKIASVGFISQGGPSLTAIPMVRDIIATYLQIPKP